MFFSIIMPTYNSEKFIKTAIDSVVCQTCSDWELIIADNHSSDNTVLLAQKYSDSRIKVVDICNDGVVAASRNKGISVANGDWLAFLDSDDAWMPEKLEVFLNYIANNSSVEILASDTLTVAYDGDNRFLTRRLGDAPLIDTFFKTGNIVPMCSSVVRKNSVDKFGIQFSEESSLAGVEDYYFWLRCAEKGLNMAWIDNPLAIYLNRGGGLSKIDASHYDKALSAEELVLSECDAVRPRRTLYLKMAKSRCAIQILRTQSLSKWSLSLIWDVLSSPIYSIRWSWSVWRLKRVGKSKWESLDWTTRKKFLSVINMSDERPS
jgi:glycosyltransferase involved in cell wall biosynthesis